MKLVAKVKDIFATREGWSTEPAERLSYYSYFAGEATEAQLAQGYGVISVRLGEPRTAGL